MFTHFRLLSTAPDFAYDNSSLCSPLRSAQKICKNPKRDCGALQKRGHNCRSVLVPLQSIIVRLIRSDRIRKEAHATPFSAIYFHVCAVPSEVF